MEEGVGNAHPNNTLPNSTHPPDSPSKGSEGGAGGDDEEKSVLQVKYFWHFGKIFLHICFQAKLTNLAIQIGYGGMAVSLVTVLILSIKFSVDKFHYEVRIRNMMMMMMTQRWSFGFGDQSSVRGNCVLKYTQYTNYSLRTLTILQTWRMQNFEGIFANTNVCNSL